MCLQSRARRQQRGVGCGDFGGADVSHGLGRLVGHRQCRTVDEGPGQLQRDVHVGELVLDRLIGTDHLAELAALLGVLDKDESSRACPAPTS